MRGKRNTHDTRHLRRADYGPVHIVGNVVPELRCRVGGGEVFEDGLDVFGGERHDWFFGLIFCEEKPC